jgi:sarcosine oxidase subunit beta
MAKTNTSDVVIIGGGLHGCSTALHLARRGVRSIVVEKNHVGRHASSANAGGVRTLGRDPREIALSLASLEIWHNMTDLVDSDCNFRADGQVRMAESEEDLQKLQERVELLRSLGFDHEELVDRAELRALVPAVAEHCLGALVCRRDGCASPFATMAAFRRKADRLGVQFEENTGVTGLRRDKGVWSIATTNGRFEAPVVVNCAGAWADRIAEAFGEAIALKATAPMGMITARMPQFVKPVVSSISRAMSFKQLSNGTVLIGGNLRGSADRDAETTSLDFHDFAARAQTVLELFPIMRSATIVRCWAAIEAETEDKCPVIGPSARAEDAYHAFGYSGHGFELGPIVGSVIAELITTGKTDMLIKPLSIDRFLPPSKSG